MKSKPWEKTTGPKTPEGKKKVAQNAVKHGMRSRKYDDISYFLWLQKRYVRAVRESYKRQK